MYLDGRVEIMHSVSALLKAQVLESIGKNVSVKWLIPLKVLKATVPEASDNWGPFCRRLSHNYPCYLVDDFGNTSCCPSVNNIPFHCDRSKSVMTGRVKRRVGFKSVAPLCAETLRLGLPLGHDIGFQ